MISVATFWNNAKNKKSKSESVSKSKSRLHFYFSQRCEMHCSVYHVFCNFYRNALLITALQVAGKIASCNSALEGNSNYIKTTVSNSRLVWAWVFGFWLDKSKHKKDTHTLIHTHNNDKS